MSRVLTLLNLPLIRVFESEQAKLNFFPGQVVLSSCREHFNSNIQGNKYHRSTMPLSFASGEDNEERNESKEKAKQKSGVLEWFKR